MSYTESAPVFVEHLLDEVTIMYSMTQLWDCQVYTGWVHVRELLSRSGSQKAEDKPKV